MHEVATEVHPVRIVGAERAYDGTGPGTPYRDQCQRLMEEPSLGSVDDVSCVLNREQERRHEFSVIREDELSFAMRDG